MPVSVAKRLSGGIFERVVSGWIISLEGDVLQRSDDHAPIASTQEESSCPDPIGAAACAAPSSSKSTGSRRIPATAIARCAEARSEHFRWLQGEDRLTAYTADNGTTRRFCEHCGSSLTFFSPLADPDLVEIALGCFDDDVPVRPDAHIYVASGAKWARPNDELPQYEAGRDSKRIR